MADITIITDGIGSGEFGGENRRVVWVSDTVGYYFYNDSGGDVNYTKTTDAGAAWGTPVEFHSLAGDISCWYDRWTPGDTGDFIHVAIFRYTGNDVYYTSLDTSDDTIGSEIVVQSFSGNRSANPYRVSITKAKGGNLYVHGFDTTNSHTFERSTDGGDSWAARATILDASQNVDEVILIPGSNAADDQDIQAIYGDVSGGDVVVTLKAYDDSANSWSESSTIVTAENGGDIFQQMAVTIRHSDEHLLLVVVDDAATVRDIRVWDLNGTGSITEKTAVISNVNLLRTVSISIDQNTDDVYIFWGRSPTTTDPVVYKKSDDGGGTWGSQQAYSETDRLYRAIDVPISVDNQGGVIGPCMWEDAAEDVWFNVGNAITIAAVAVSKPGHVMFF